MRRQIKEIYQIILQLIQREIQVGHLKLSQFHLVGKIINHVGIEMSVSLKARDITDGKPLLHRDKYSLGRKCLWNYRAAVSMLSYLQGSTCT